MIVGNFLLSLVRLVGGILTLQSSTTGRGGLQMSFPGIVTSVARRLRIFIPKTPMATETVYSAWLDYNSRQLEEMYASYEEGDFDVGEMLSFDEYCIDQYDEGFGR